VMCGSFLEYLNTFAGAFGILAMGVSFAVSLLAVSSAFFFLRGKKLVGYILLSFFILALLLISQLVNYLI
jgi:hypothetical protein